MVPVLVGTAAAVHHGHIGRLDWLNAACALVVSLALQVGTNYANDYSDGIRGTDDPAERIGPPRLVGNGLTTPGNVKRAMLAAFGVALVAGTVLVVRVGWELIPVGVAAVAAGWFYTGGPHPYGYAGLGEAFVFTFFGLVATVGSTYVQLDHVTWLSVGCGAAIGALATAILVVNNLRDIPGDQVSGKRTLAVRLGDQRTRILYVVLMVVPYLLVPFIAGASGRILGVLAFLALPMATRPVRMVLTGKQGRDLIPALAGTAQIELLYGVTLAIGLVLWI
jgi:1,4-dihydroxy-2-naphthoate octaprenyltransferase